jgi:vacuolar-type H+-ATPase subunit I/STV1
MSPRTLFLGRLIGLYCILAALVMLLRGQATVDTVTLLLRDAPLMFVLGVLTLFAGLAMVLAHNVWSGSALAVIVTLVGWATLIKGLLFMILTPEAEAAVFLKGLHYQESFRLYAALSLAAGAYLTYRGFGKNPRA